jgi:hypothetical protein
MILIQRCLYVFRMDKNSNNRRNDSQNQQQQQMMSSQLTQVIGQLVGKLVGRNTSLTYSFENLEIDVPKAQGLDGRKLGGAKWTTNGKIAVTTEMHNARSST